MNSKIGKNKKNSSVENFTSDMSVSDAINNAFDNTEISTVGKLCLDARVNKGLTQEQASAILKVRLKIIQDFENGDFIDLPGLAYKIGFVRSYARLLGLDGDLLVKEFKESIEIGDLKEEYKFLSPVIERNRLLPVGAVISFLICTIFYTGWYYSDRNNEIRYENSQTVSSTNVNDSDYTIIEENFNLSTSNDAEVNILPKITEKKDLTANIGIKATKNLIDNKMIANENDYKKNNDDIKNKIINETNEMSAEANERNPSTEMVLKALGNSWVEIEDIDGNILMTRLMRPGETYVVPNISGLTFNTGNAGALSLSQGKIIIPSLGEIGEIIKARPLNIKAFMD